MNADKLVRMANEIAVFFRLQGEEQAVAAIADHIRSFWSPVMRRRAYAHLDAGAAGLEPLALRALQQLQQTDQAAQSKV